MAGVDLDGEFELSVFRLVAEEEEGFLVVGTTQVVEATRQLPCCTLVADVLPHSDSNIMGVRTNLHFKPSPAN